MKPIIFYDGSCGLCKREIAHYQKLDKQHSIEWVDIVASQDRLKNLNIEFLDAMEVLHGVNEQGELVKGVANFMIIWNKLPQYRWLAWVIQILRLQPLLQWGYLHFAKWRFKRRMSQGCDLAK